MAIQIACSQIQKQIQIQMEKTNTIRNKQQVVIGQLVSQVKVMQKQLGQGEQFHQSHQKYSKYQKNTKNKRTKK